MLTSPGQAADPHDYFAVYPILLLKLSQSIAKALRSLELGLSRPF